ncbi:hypothetical protein NECAME_05778 [Necator americanus]|uniref:AMP-dependent synthetase/ligase domain-containing protein n=1 Tax=Necator americanus TaxID=51031 RepID=W2U0U8_NECAM|nr:hypothetical protein NECAME_05778 [Necator americanus]ETN86932.1 hypothetical protein NECAME_05778 [Necator americanus]
MVIPIGFTKLMYNFLVEVTKSVLEMVLFSSYAEVPVCNTPLHEKVLTAILQHMDRNPNRIAFISAEDPAVRITFKEIYNQAYSVASFLSSRYFVLLYSKVKMN